MRANRRGFTLIELLVVIAIIAVLIGLLAARGAGGPRGGPSIAVRQQPQAARPGRAQLPRRERGASRPRANATRRSSRTFSFKTRIVPYIEQQAVFNAINFISVPRPRPPRAATTRKSTNRTAFVTQIGALLCPSDSNIPGPDAGNHNYPENLGPAAIAARSHGTTGIGYFPGRHSRNACGANVNPLNFNAPVSFRSVTDGLSNTVVFGEYVKGRGSLGPDGLHMVYGLTDAQECDVTGAPNPDFLLNEMCHASKRGWTAARAGNGCASPSAAAAATTTRCRPTARPAPSAPGLSALRVDRRQLQPPRRRQHGVHGRLGQVRQDHDQLQLLAGHRHHGRRRGHQRRRTLRGDGSHLDIPGDLPGDSPCIVGQPARLAHSLSKASRPARMRPAWSDRVPIVPGWAVG